MERSHLNAWVIPQVLDGGDKGRVKGGHSLIVYGPDQITLFLNFMCELFRSYLGTTIQLAERQIISLLKHVLKGYCSIFILSKCSK